ncbi:DNA polymerase III subunit alpha [Candidatus Erwinia haradaeae]|uniref:DNA polymerase III subunit alpha n=1 Tax=Candidatus Erwinia haradaeae TaxID=1922217 RepID=A0A451DL49_9GAMM|nr:DNA polymerase III subunit alpha [Candidatus Erwinia haradaeae]VFP87452.1 DNA polymerase III subunit alpha [Candidatus Erwinia haradaeae]
MPEPRFIHLHVRSDYSITDGLTKIASLVMHAANMGMPALAITDFTNLFGLIKFYKIAHDYGLKPIIGADFRISCCILGNELPHITILAANNKGYRNLTLLISRAYLRGYGSHGPTIDRDWLREHQEGLILLSGGHKGDVGKMLLRGNQIQAHKFLNFYQKHFPNRYYLTLSRTGRLNEEIYLNAALELAGLYTIPVVATNNVCFLSKSDFEAHEIRVAIQNGYTLGDPKRPKSYSAQQYLRSEEDMCTLFADIPEALENSIEITRRCNVTIQLGKYFLPQFPTGRISTEYYLIQKAQHGLKVRLAHRFPDRDMRILHYERYQQRLNKELQVINQMGFPGYFLIVMEFIQWAKEQGIPVGPGRGSGAGSLVAYVLKITDIDPLEFNLLFERFLNPERISMPDFDIDFCMEKRDLVIEHVANIYGRHSVSQIITFGTMAAKAVIRDVGRVLGHPYVFVDRIAKAVPLDPGMTLEKALQCSSSLIELYNTDEEVKSLIDMARKLEGVTRNAGKHAGGVVISPTKITDFSPLYCDEKGQNPVTQFDKNDVEYTGLVKFDFLGLRTLTILDWALEMINARLKKNGLKLIEICEISLSDPKSFQILQNAETTAVFQLESRGMKDLIKRLKPDCFEDIIALVALFRPGPLQSGMVDNFINRKQGREKISYPDAQWEHKLLRPVLESTYGIILYQEQVMQIAQVLAGYSLGSADILRRAMGKKNLMEMVKQRSIFEKGAKEKGINSVLAMKIFNLVEKFAGYGFNKSHSAAYALVSYQTLWVKAHYPAEFMAAVMNADIDNTDKIVILVGECWRIGLTVLPPNINSGLHHFYVNDKGEIVYGLGAIKGVGLAPISEIIQSRNQGGCFYEMFSFCSRINIKKINRRVLEKLIISGALDCFGQHRAALISALPNAIKSSAQYSKAGEMGQSDIFGVLLESQDLVQQTYSNVKPWPENVRLEREKETLGFYLTGHPINPYLEEISNYTSGHRLKDVRPTKKGEMTTIAGVVVASRVIATKKGHRMGVCTLDDRSGKIEVKLFKDLLDKFKYLLDRDRILIVTGQVSVDRFNGGMQIIAQKIIDINMAREKHTHYLSLFLLKSNTDERIIQKLHDLLIPYCPGTSPIRLHYQGNNYRVTLCFGESWRVSLHDSLLNDLRFLLGFDKVKLEFY